LRPVEKTADHRRSRRYASRLDVELAQGSATQRCYSIDVSRHGIFLATERPPRERFLVRVVIQLPDGALFANAFVSRSVPPGSTHAPGVGLQFFAMPEMTRKRWDQYVSWLSGVAAPSDADAVASSFMVKLPDRTKLREFFDKVSRTTNIYMVTPVVRPVGSPVAVVLVHPETKLEFVLSGKIARVRLEAPKGVEIRLTPLTVGDIQAFDGFLGGDSPEEAWPAPPSGPVAAPPDPDLDPLMDFEGTASSRESGPVPTGAAASLHATLPRPSFPAEPVVRSGDVAPISADLPKAISVDIGGPEAEPDKVTAEQRFDWSVVSDDLVIDVDLSEIEGEDLAELRGEINVRITRPPTRVPTADLPEYVLDGASDLIPLPRPSQGSEPVIGGMNPPAGAIASLNASEPVIGGMNPPAGAIASLNASEPVIGGMNPPAGAIASLNASEPVIGGMNPPAGAIGLIPAPNSEPPPAPAPTEPTALYHRDAELPRELGALSDAVAAAAPMMGSGSGSVSEAIAPAGGFVPSPTHDRTTADLRHLPRARPLSRSEDAPTGSTRPSDPTLHSSGDVFRELTPPPQPRRLRSTADLDDEVLPIRSTPPVTSAPPEAGGSAPPVASATPEPVPTSTPPAVGGLEPAAEILAKASVDAVAAAPLSSATSTSTSVDAVEAAAPVATSAPLGEPSPPLALQLPPPATTRPDLAPAAALVRDEAPAEEEPLDEDAPSERARSESSLPAEPAEDPVDSEDEYPALDPIRALDLSCAHCGTSSKLKAGHPAPPLGLFASYRTYSCKKCRLFVSVLRLASSRTRGIVKRVLEASGGLDGPAPLSVAFDVADLAQPARCPDCTSMLRVTKQTDAIEAALDTGGTEPQTLSKVSCPRCHEYGVKLA